MNGNISLEFGRKLSCKRHHSGKFEIPVLGTTSTEIYSSSLRILIQYPVGISSFFVVYDIISHLLEAAIDPIGMLGKF